MTVTYLKELLQQLGLPAAAAALEQRLETAVKQQVTHLEFLADLVLAEEAERQARYLAARTRLANLPFKKTLADFDFGSRPSIDEHQIWELGTLDFAQQSANMDFLGPLRLGKMVCCYNGTMALTFRL